MSVVAVVQRPQDRLLQLFRSACELMETMANAPESQSMEADRRLQQSNVKVYIKEMIDILEEEGRKWKFGHDHSNDDPTSYTPCMDLFLQTRMVQELCNRAVLDLPRGCLPLVLSMLAILLRTVSYPLLPHMTVHKPIANLVSVAVRYDAMHMYTNAGNSNTAGSTIANNNNNNNNPEAYNKQEYTSYKRRVGK